MAAYWPAVSLGDEEPNLFLGDLDLLLGDLDLFLGDLDLLLGELDLLLGFLDLLGDRLRDPKFLGEFSSTSSVFLFGLVLKILRNPRFKCPDNFIYYIQSHI